MNTFGLQLVAAAGEGCAGVAGWGQMLEMPVGGSAVSKLQQPQEPPEWHLVGCRCLPRRRGGGSQDEFRGAHGAASCPSSTKASILATTLHQRGLRPGGRVHISRTRWSLPGCLRGTVAPCHELTSVWTPAGQYFGQGSS